MCELSVQVSALSEFLHASIHLLLQTQDLCAPPHVLHLHGAQGERGDEVDQEEEHDHALCQGVSEGASLYQLTLI